MQKKQTVLIVDDVTQNIVILNNTLKAAYNTLFAKSGEEALKIARENKPDLILLDVMMPGMNGFEVCKELKKDEALKNIPVIFVTALNDTGNESEGLNLGAVDYIRKPYNIDIVKLRVRNHLKMKEYRDELIRLSNTDRLTAIPNRRAIMEAFEREIKLSIRNQQPIGFMMLDIDFFKNYNDNYGHIAGDVTLYEVAQAISKILERPTDMVGRYGGEEFLCILPNTDKKGVMKKSQDILEAVSGLGIPHQYSDVSCVITISIGACSLVPELNKTVEYYVDLADKALYHSKNTGRNKISYCQQSAL
ncbi:MAG: diguanylate cyclase domain-containing protein [Thermotogota bacterium]